MAVYKLTDELVFPPVYLAEPEGLLAVGGDLSAERLLLGYQFGIFPWYSAEDPILWWSPDPRLLLYPNELLVSRSLARTIRKGNFQITFDSAFAEVISACALARGKNREGTWITDEMMMAYIQLHNIGYAHSVEAWQDDNLVGGLYGVSLGRAFFGESMFSSVSDASKVALVYLRDFLQANEFDFIDCQVPSDHLLRLGARTLARTDFLYQLSRSLKYPTIKGRWNTAHLV